MGRISARGKTTSYPISGGWVADTSVTIPEWTAGTASPRKLFLPKAARPGGQRFPVMCWYGGSPGFRGTNANPTVMNNTTNIASDFPATQVIANALSLGWAVFVHHFPGGNPSIPGEFPNALYGRQAFDTLLDQDLRNYPLDPDRIVLMGFSGGGAQHYRTLFRNPRKYAALVILDAYFRELGGDEGNAGTTPPSDVWHTATTPQEAWDQFVARCGHVPLWMNTSGEWATTGPPTVPAGLTATFNDPFMATYTNAGLRTTASNYSTSTTHPTVGLNEKYPYVKYSGYTHQTLVQNIPILAHTNLWDWMGARRRGE